MKTIKYTTSLLFVAACLSLNVARAAEGDDKPKGDRPDRAERGERMKEMMEKRAEELKAADTNKDGSISLDELKAQSATKSEEAFKKADANSDGKLTPDEAKALAGPGGRGPGGRGPGGRGPGGPDGDKPAAPEGDLTLDAFKAKAAERAEGGFKRMDKDSDGKVTEAEIKAMGEGRGPGGRGGRDGDKPGEGKGPKPEGAGFGPKGDNPPPAAK